MDGNLDGLMGISSFGPKMMELTVKTEMLRNYVEDLNAAGAAMMIQEIWEKHYSPTFYDSVQALYSVIFLAFISLEDSRVKMVDLVPDQCMAAAYIPKRGEFCPALLLGLVWNETAEEALAQEKHHGYRKILLNLGHDVILVGISFDETSRKHSCRIEFEKNPANRI